MFKLGDRVKYVGDREGTYPRSLACYSRIEGEVGTIITHNEYEYDGRWRIRWENSDFNNSWLYGDWFVEHYVLFELVLTPEEQEQQLDRQRREAYADKYL